MNNKKKPVGVAANDSSTSGINKPIFKTLLSLGDFHTDQTPFFYTEVTIKLTSRKLTDVIG